MLATAALLEAGYLRGANRVETTKWLQLPKATWLEQEDLGPKSLSNLSAKNYFAFVILYYHYLCFLRPMGIKISCVIDH